MNQNPLWSRRKFSKAIVSLQLLVGSGALLTPGCSPGDPPSNDATTSILDETRKNILKLAMDEIIPKSQKMPSASEVGGIDYILSVFEEYPDLIPAFQQVLDALNEQCIDSHDKDFDQIGSNERIRVLKNFENARKELFEVLKDMVYESYYINEKVWELIGYEPYPTMQAGPEMEPFDESLLDRVKQMKPLFINPKS